MRRFLRRLWRRATSRPVPAPLQSKVEAIDPRIRAQLERFRG